MKKFLPLFALLLLFACQENRLPNQGDGLYAVIETSKGDIVTRLEHQKAPLSVANFVGLAEGDIENKVTAKGEPFFDGLTFHRVEPGFVIQGGDPLANGMGGPGYKFRQEINPDLKHNVAGTLAMANAGPNTNGSQFYITLAPTPFLDGGYNVFGYVVDGLSVATSIGVGDTIRHIEIIRKGNEARSFKAPQVFKEQQNQ
ncbi:MAG: peptidylprolyl isomerase [Bacteroidota bacterium]